MVSLLENNRKQKDIIFYIVDDGISEEKKLLLNNMVAQYECDNIKRSVVYLEALGPEILLKFPYRIFLIKRAELIPYMYTSARF